MGLSRPPSANRRSGQQTGSRGPLRKEPRFRLNQVPLRQQALKEFQTKTAYRHETRKLHPSLLRPMVLVRGNLEVALLQLRARLRLLALDTVITFLNAAQCIRYYGENA